MNIIRALAAVCILVLVACDNSSDPEGLSPGVARGRIHQLGHTYSLNDYRSAIENSDIELFKLYLQSGLLMDQSVEGMSAPCIAAAARSQTILTYLHDKDVNLLSLPCDRTDRTPLMVAIQDGRDWLTIDWLLSEAEDLNHLESSGHYVLSFTTERYTDYLTLSQRGELRDRIVAKLAQADQAVDNPSDFSHAGFAVDAFLVVASLEGDFSALKFGLDNGGDANQANSQGNTLLELVLSIGWFEGADYLFSRGARVTEFSPISVPILIQVGRLISLANEGGKNELAQWLDLSAKMMVFNPEAISGEDGQAIVRQFWQLVPGELHGTIHQSVAKYKEMAKKTSTHPSPH